MTWFRFMTASPTMRRNVLYSAVVIGSSRSSKPSRTVTMFQAGMTNRSLLL